MYYLTSVHMLGTKWQCLVHRLYHFDSQLEHADVGHGNPGSKGIMRCMSSNEGPLRQQVLLPYFEQLVIILSHPQPVLCAQGLLPNLLR